jgi:hypothetical protein
MLAVARAAWADFRARYAALHERRKPLAGVHIACVLGSLLWIAPLFPHTLAVLGTAACACACACVRACVRAR